MSGFSFNFLPTEASNETAVVDEPIRQAPRKPFVWIDRLDELLAERSQEELVYTTISSATNDSNVYKVEERHSSFLEAKTDDNKSSENGNIVDGGNEESIWTRTDLQPGVYEGGMRVWECSLDLTHYLLNEYNTIEQQSNEPVSVLELGCGHALPSCAILRQYLQQRKADGIQLSTANNNNNNSYRISFDLLDYNKHVLKDVTISNLVINSASILCSDTDSVDERNKLVASLSSFVRLGAGDWLDFSTQSLDKSSEIRGVNDGDGDEGETHKYSLILAAETLYTAQAAKDTALLIHRHLRRSDTSVALVATKRYYFGVGGGVDDFCQTLHKYELDDGELVVDVLKVYDNGIGNIRELLKICWRKV